VWVTLSDWTIVTHITPVFAKVIVANPQQSHEYNGSWTMWALLFTQNSTISYVLVDNHGHKTTQECQVCTYLVLAF